MSLSWKFLYHYHHINWQCLINIILGWGWSATNFLCCSATSVTVSIWYTTKSLPNGYLAKKVRLGVSNMHCFSFRFPWMQDDLDAPAAPVNEEPTEQNVDTSQAVQVWNNIHRILCHQWLFIQTADILDIENICWLISLCVGPRPTRVTSTRTFSTGLLRGTQ